MVTNLLFDERGTQITASKRETGVASVRVPSSSPPARPARPHPPRHQYPDSRGPAGDAPSVQMAQVIENIGLTVSRFKTGTPPRIDGRSVNWSRVERQDGDGDEFRFSFHERVERPRQVPCWITWAGEK